MKQLKFIFLLIILVGCEEIIEVEDISDEIILTLAPTDGAVLNITDINFSWDILEEADQYKLQIATPSFEEANQIVLDTTITETNYTQMLLPESYEWRVRGENSDFQTEYTTQSFTVEE